MKRKIALVLCVIMAAAMALTGCGEEKKFVGTWNCELDLSELLESALAGSDFYEHLEIDELTITVECSFTDDGTYQYRVEKDSLDALEAEMGELIVEAMEAYFIAEIAADNMGLTLEEFYQQAGTSRDQLLAQSGFTQVLSMMRDAIDQGFNMTGEFKAEDGKLYTSSPDQPISEGKYETYTFVNDSQFTLTGQVGSEDSDYNIYPVTFTKVA